MIPPLSSVGVTRYHRPTKNFTSIRNTFHRDIRVKPRAAKVGAYLLTHADGFTQSQAQLAANTGLSIMTVRAALGDLAGLGYMAMKVIRERGRVIGTAYAMADTPFTHEELAELASADVTSPPCTDSVPTKSVHPKKTRSRRDSSPEEEDQPLRGAPGGVTVDHVEAEMTKPDPVQAALFEAPKPPKRPASAEDPSARTVVAAYVDSHRRHQGGDPLRRDIGRVARDAKALLDRGEASPHELEAAARELGQSTWSNIGTALKIRRRREQPSATGATQPIPYGSDRWERLEAEQLEAAASRPVSAELQAMRDRYTSSAVAGVA